MIWRLERFDGSATSPAARSLVEMPQTPSVYLAPAAGHKVCAEEPFRSVYLRCTFLPRTGHVSVRGGASWKKQQILKSGY